MSKDFYNFFDLNDEDDSETGYTDPDQLLEDIDDDELEDEAELAEAIRNAKQLANLNLKDKDEDDDLENSFFDLDEVFKEPSKQDHERQLDKIPINIIENYLRKKKLHNINKNQNEN